MARLEPSNPRYYLLLFRRSCLSPRVPRLLVATIRNAKLASQPEGGDQRFVGIKIPERSVLCKLVALARSAKEINSLQSMRIAHALIAIVNGRCG